MRYIKRLNWKMVLILVIDETEALTVIDVNTGKFSGRNDLAETVVKTNLAAAAGDSKTIASS